MDETTAQVWEFIGWLLFGDHLTVAVPSQAGLVVIGWWLRGKRDERRLRKQWLATFKREGDQS